jgi:hypothetical protein
VGRAAQQGALHLVLPRAALLPFEQTLERNAFVAHVGNLLLPEVAFRRRFLLDQLLHRPDQPSHLPQLAAHVIQRLSVVLLRPEQ